MIFNPLGDAEEGARPVVAILGSRVSRHGLSDQRQESEIANADLRFRRSVQRLIGADVSPLAGIMRARLREVGLTLAQIKKYMPYQRKEDADLYFEAFRVAGIPE